MKNGIRTAAYARVRDQFGYCGIWCGSYVVGNGTLRELSGQDEDVTKNYDPANWEL